ncbi:hypothetical protein TWF694_010895 [Orbilia ellipsospora]|uniref:DUF7707 domain-containing protein n=1 Tax=Orbilia ellipsospora TaxID=2528407 RepID=A0AAV9X8J6_9PEZI
MQFTTSVAVTLATILSSVSAQTYYVPDPKDIDLLTKQTWCSDQVASCGLLCLDQNSGGGYTNSCDPDDLSWQCVCADGTVPNATQYTQTIPYFICIDEVQGCVNNCPQADATCSQGCVNGKVCGATDPKKVTTTSKSGSNHAATSTGAPAASGTSGSSNGGDDKPYDAPTGTASSQSTGGSSSDDKSDDGKSNAASRLLSINGGAFSVMVLSFLCGSFVILL